MSGTINNTTIDTTALLASNVSPIYNHITSDLHFFSEKPKMNSRERIAQNFYQVTPEQNQVNIAWQGPLQFICPKLRMICRSIGIEVRTPPITFVDSTQVPPTPRVLALGEYCQFVPYFLLQLFQGRQALIHHGGQSRLVQRASLEHEIVSDLTFENLVDYEQKHKNMGGGPYWTPAKREAAVLSGNTFSAELTDIFFNQNKHNEKYPIIFSAFAAQFSISFTLSDPTYLLQTNIVNKADIVFPVPTIVLNFRLEEVGPTLFNQLKNQHYFNKALDYSHFVQYTTVAKIPIATGLSSYVANLQQLSSSDLRNLFFYITDETENVPSTTSDNLAPYNNRPFEAANYYKINSFYFTINNVQASIEQTHDQNMNQLKLKYNLKALPRIYLYFNTYTEMPRYSNGNNISAGSNNLGSKQNYNLVIKFDTLPSNKYLHIRMAVENLLVKQNSDISPVLAN